MHSVLLSCSAQHHLLPREAAGPGEAVSFPATVLLPPFHQDFPLLPFFTHFFQSNLQSPFSVAPLGMLLPHLVDLFLLLRITLCYGLFVLSCFGIYIYFLFLQKFNSVLNQSRNDLLCGFSLDLEAY